MARETTKWPSNRGPITKIMPSDGCKGDAVPLGGRIVVHFPRSRMSSGECRIEISSDDGLVGRDNVRYPAFDGDTMTITARPGLLGGEGSEANIVWRRAKRP